MLNVQQLTISFPDRTLFEQASFQAADGELVAIVIADMDLDPVALAEVEEAFIGAGLL